MRARISDGSDLNQNLVRICAVRTKNKFGWAGQVWYGLVWCLVWSGRVASPSTISSYVKPRYLLGLCWSSIHMCKPHLPLPRQMEAKWPGHSRVGLVWAQSHLMLCRQTATKQHMMCMAKGLALNFVLPCRLCDRYRNHFRPLWIETVQQ